MTLVIDATDSIVGRVAAYAAKQALLGKDVVIVNSEKAVISGKKENVFDKYIQKRSRGIPLKGPYHPRQPDRILRRAVRGMLPYKKPNGKAAFKRVMCYVGVPEKFSKQDAITVEGANVSKLPTFKYVSLKDLSRRLGVKVE